MKKKSSESGATLMKTKSSGAGALFMKKRALEPELCHSYDSSTALQPMDYCRFNSYPLYIALLSDARWIGNPTNYLDTTVSVSPSCLSVCFLNHVRFGESNYQR